MEGKLIKRGEGDYRLFVNDTPYAQSKESPYRKLSLKNCQAIENGYDLDEMADTYAIQMNLEGHNITKEQDQYFKDGFRYALEILGDKKFSEEDVISMIRKSRETGLTAEYLILAFQQTEWDVEIEMEQYVKYVPKSLETVYPTGGVRPVLDAEDCLILKLNK